MIRADGIWEKGFLKVRKEAINVQKGGTKWKVTCISNEPFIFFNVAVPVSSQGLDYELFPITSNQPV